MIKYFLKAFKITNENIILTTPLILFVLILSLYLGVLNNAPQNIYFAVLTLVTIVAMLAAFFAGWLFMVKKAVDLSKQEFIADEEKAKASFALLKQITVGIGEFFPSFVGALVLYTILSFILGIIGYYIGINLIGKVDIDLNSLKAALNSAAEMKIFISSLSVVQLQKLNQWYLLFLAFISFFYYITLFWSAEIITSTKNPVVAFFKSFVFTFKNFLATLIIFVYITLINFTTSLFTSLSTINPILYFIATLLYFYFVVYYVVLIFLYYDNEKAKTKDNSDSGSDSVGQDCLCNPESTDE